MKRTWTMAQQRRYRALCKLLAEAQGFDDEARRLVIGRVCEGAASTTEIDRDGMTALIKEMQGLCRQAGVALERRPGDKPPKRLRQNGYIALLQRQLGWDEGRLAGFIRRQFKGWKDSVLQLATAEKSELITALKAEKASQEAGKARRERTPEERQSRNAAWGEVVRGGQAPPQDRAV